MTEKETTRKTNIKRFKYFIVSFLLLFIVFMVISIYYVHWSLKPAETGEALKLEIPRGSSGGEIAEMLEDKGLIRSSLTFKALGFYKGYGGSYQAGKYKLDSEMTPLEIAEKIKSGEVVDSSIKITIPEGLRADQLASALGKNSVGEKEKFLELFDSPEKFDYWFLDENMEKVKFSLEGFLYPETYNIGEEDSEKEIVDKLLQQFDSVFTEEYREQKRGLGLDINEVITMASIVEREAVVDKERSKIAGVFYNRLNEDRKLEACATVEYVLQENKPRLTTEDTEIDSYYNTYKYQGLPPGPIASPGVKSIEAALNPENHEYYYFVSKEDGSGEHVFSRTHAEHEKARQRIRN